MMRRDTRQRRMKATAVKSLPTLYGESSRMENSFTRSNRFHLLAFDTVDTFAH